eukprot:gnl/TRDRNA2_/TRDRNA2_185718_c0_seq1.p1 gnl/TRDRNA2_/TRDRNA2_185718_c0~~gnl/TRDRNA2_/TRDRNA2_185718_c0_seq1.p1  ORF type:complete len:113 (-),score=4.94 gnl/TRDRNA2_/TRDRNA2_185718_c0_seq1:51-389(-)
MLVNLRQNSSYKQVICASLQSSCPQRAGHRDVPAGREALDAFYYGIVFRDLASGMSLTVYVHGGAGGFTRMSMGSKSRDWSILYGSAFREVLVAPGLLSHHSAQLSACTVLP